MRLKGMISGRSKGLLNVAIYNHMQTAGIVTVVANNNFQELHCLTQECDQDLYNYNTL